MTSAPSGGGTGPARAETQRWRDAAAELAPAKSYERLIDNGRSVMTTVSTVGVLLTGFGLVAADRLANETGPALLAAAAVALAVVAILMTLLALVVRHQQINLDNVSEVQRVYRDELRKTWLVRTAQWTLAVALGCAGAAGSWSAVDAAVGHPIRTAAAVTYVADMKEPKVHATASLTGLRAGTVVTLSLAATVAGEGDRVLMFGTAAADGDGKASWDETVGGAAGATRYQLTVAPAGHRAVTVATAAP